MTPTLQGLGVAISVNLIRVLRQPKYPIIAGTLVVPLALGFISLAIQKDQHGLINGLMGLLGAGTGLTFAPTGKLSFL